MTESSTTCPEKHKHQDITTAQGGAKGGQTCGTVANGSVGTKQAWGGSGNGESAVAVDPAPVDGKEVTLQSLEEASAAGDDPRTCTLLQLLRQQLSEQSRKSWSAEVLKRLWGSAANVLRSNPCPEVKSRACQLLEVLGQNCKTCLEGDWEGMSQEGAPDAVIGILRQAPQDLTLLSAAVRAVLSFSGCLTCRSYYDRATQDMLGSKESVEVLISTILRLQEIASKNTPEAQASKVARRAIADGLQALHFLCLMNKGNVAILAANQGLRAVRTCIEDDGNELTVQEHGCMVLAELACRPDASDQEIIECVATVTNVARLQMQEKFIEVARAAVWSLTRIASNALHPYNHQQQDTWMAGLWQVWPIMQGQALHMIVDMMQSCQLKDDPLVKHCLDFIAVVGGDDGGCKGGLSSNLEGMSALSFAVSIVYHQVFLSAQDTRMQAVALRTLYSLLSNPKCLAVDIPLPRAIDAIMKSMRNALRWRETTSKDIFCVECFGMGVIFKLLEPPDESESQEKHVAPNLLSQYILDIHAAIAYIARFIEEGGEKFNFDFKSLNLEEPVVEVSCCRYACHCCFLHEPCKGRDVLLAVEGSAVCLQCCGGDSINSTDHDGLMILHRLAQSGLSECLEMFISAAGDGIDFLKRTKCGLNALHLARASKNPESVSVLEKATEAAADAAQIALLKELAMEDSKQQKNPNAPGKKPKKKRTAQCTDGTDKKISTEEIDTTKERDEEDKKRREEAEKIKRKLDEQYEQALEERRRQIEEQEKLMLQEAQQASLEDDRIRQQQEKQVEGEHGRYNHQHMLSQLQHLARKSPSDVGTQPGAPMPLSPSPPQHHVHHHHDNHSSSLAPGAHAINASTPPQSPHGMDQSSHANGCTNESQPMATPLQGNQAHDLHAQMSSTLAAMAASMASPAVDADVQDMQTPPPPTRSGDLDNVLGLVPPAQISGTSPPPMHHLQQSHMNGGTELNGISQSWHGPMPEESMAGMDVMHKPPPANSWQSVFVDHQSGETADHRVREPWHPDQEPPRIQDPHIGPWEFNPVRDGPPLDLAAQHEAMMAGPVMEAMDVPPWASYPERLGNGSEPLSAGMQTHPGYNLPNPSMIEGAHDPKIGSQSQQMPDGHSGWMVNSMSQAQGMANGGERGAHPEVEEDVDDHQILMHWLSSEITGLIENGAEKGDGATNGLPPTSFPAGDINTPDRPIRNLLPTLSNPPRYRSAAFTGASWGGEGYETWDRPMSPMGGGSPGGPGAFLRQSSMQQFGTPSRSPQVWVPKTMIRGADPRLVSPGGVGGPWEGMSPALLPDSFLETEDSKVPSKHLWLGNLNTRLPRSILKSIFEDYGAVEDVVTFPGRMYAFVNFVNCEDAQRAARELDMKEIPALTANRKLVIKFRPNRKALGRVGDLMPGVHPTEEQGPSLSSSRSAPSFQSWDSPTAMGCTKSHMQVIERIRMRKGHPDYNPAWEEVEEEIRICEIERASDEDLQLPEGKPSRHLWLGNISLRPSKTVLFSLFSRYGPVESVRIFPGKTFAFVNFQQAQHAARAKEALDAEVVSAISGTKPLVVRFQREGSGPPAWFRVNSRRGFRMEDSPGQDRRGLPGMAPNMPSPGMSMSGMPSPGVGMSGMPSPGMNGPGMPSPGMNGPGMPSPGMNGPGMPSPGMNGPGMPSPGMPSPGMNGPGMPSPGMNGGMPSPAMNGGMPSPAMNGSGMPSPGMGPPGMGGPGMASPGMGRSQWQGARFEDGMQVPDDGAYPLDDAPILNLSNRLNPNNIHYDSQLASRYKRMAKGDKEALWADDRQQMVEEGQQVGGDMLSPLIHQTVREADSIGRLTRTLSAATLGRSPADFCKSPGDVPRSSGEFGKSPGEFGKSPGDYDRSNPWAAGSQPMYRNSFGDGSKLGMYSQQQPEMYADHLSPLPPIDRSRSFMTRRHHHTPSLPEFPTDFSGGNTASMRSGHGRMMSEVPAGMQENMMSPSQTHFVDAPQAMTGSLGQFGNSSMPPDVYASGPVSASLGRGMSSGAMMLGQTPMMETSNGLWG